MTQALALGQVDTCFPFMSDAWHTEQSDFSETYEVMSATVSLVDESSYDPESIRSIAVTDVNPMQTVYASVWYPDYALVHCESEQACLRAVLAGEADATLMLSSRAQVLLSAAEFRALRSMQSPRNASFCFGLVRDNIALLTILNRAIAALDSTEVIERTNAALPYRISYTIADFVREHMRLILVLAAAVILLIAGTFLVYAIKSRRVKRKLNDARNEALRASAAKTSFLFNMFHDIRTPMNAIIGYTDLALRDETDDEKRLEYLAKIKTSGQHLLTLINDVLEMSSIESGKLHFSEQDTDLYRACSENAELLRNQMEAKRIRYTTDFSGIRDRYVHCDINHLNRVMMNLIGNALKFTPEGGSVSVSAAQGARKEADYGEYELRVRDTGIGMSEEFAAKLFTAFERERTSTVSGIQGTGLGMAIAKSIIDALGGTIEVKSKQGEGTEFIVRLRLKIAERAPQPEVDAPAASEEAQPRDRTARVLLVEDNEINREIASLVLDSAGFLVEEAVNGEEAVKRVEASEPGYFDVVLMDVQMPVMDGYEATRAIRALPDPRLASIPIIALTANALSEDVLSAQEAGMNDHIGKPFEVDELVAKVEKFIDSSAATSKG